MKKCLVLKLDIADFVWCIETNWAASTRVWAAPFMLKKSGVFSTSVPGVDTKLQLDVTYK